MVERLRLLVLCVHNSGRSQMAAAFLNRLGADLLTVESAGFDPRPLNPLVVTAMKEIGYDLSNNQPQSAFRLYQEGHLYDCIITVCNESVEDQCPTFPGVSKRLHWPFPDPHATVGTVEQRLAQVRAIRDQIQARVAQWIEKLRREGLQIATAGEGATDYSGSD